MKKKYWENIGLLFNDNVSLIYEVCINDYYQDRWAMKDELDLLRYPKSSPFYDPTNKNVVGMFKDEASGQLITEFGGWGLNFYSYQTLIDPSHGEAGLTTQRAKGIQCAEVAKVQAEQYKEQLDHPQETYVPNRRIGSKLNQIYGIEVWSWIATLSALDII